MLKTTTLRTAIGALGVLMAGTTLASAYGSSTPGIDGAQANQRWRIEQGRRDGSLTPAEYQRLLAEQRRIEMMESKAKADGHISYAERERIRRAQGEASQHIWQERHDSERRRTWGWRWWR